VGAQYTHSLSDALATAGIGLPLGAVSVTEADTRDVRQQYSEAAVLGGFAEEVLGLNDRLFLTVALRADGAGGFGEDYHAALYPKASASWLVSREPFFQGIRGLDELRLRYAYGASGQQAKASWARPSFYVSSDIGQTPFILVSGVGNPELRPERVREHEFGFDATGLARRLELEASWFRRRTTDAIVFVPSPPVLGTSMNATNLGLTTEHGFELLLTAHVLDTRLASWDLVLQHSDATTKLVSLGGAVGTGFVEGYPLGAFFVTPVLGYQDQNGDGIISSDELQLGPLQSRYMGPTVPPRTETLTGNFGLFDRHLRLSAILERKSGFVLQDPLSCYQGSCRAGVDIHTTPADQVAAMLASGVLSYQAIELVERGDYTRFREMTASLDLPARLIRSLRVSGAALEIRARNVALWWKFKGPDPESSHMYSLGSSAAVGIPQNRAVTMSLNLQFGTGSASISH